MVLVRRTIKGDPTRQQDWKFDASCRPPDFRFARLAQWLERSLDMREVAGSSPALRTNFVLALWCKGLAHHPFKVKMRVRVPLGLPSFAAVYVTGTSYRSTI